MNFIIGMHKNAKLEGTHLSKVQCGLWDTIEAPNADEAAKIFWKTHYRKVKLQDSGPLYEITNDGHLKLFEYYIENLEIDDPGYVW